MQRNKVFVMRRSTPVRFCWRTEGRHFLLGIPNFKVYLQRSMLICAFSYPHRMFQSAVGGCASYHSANFHRFYTNRYHKKVCPKCSRPNILPAIKCAFCYSLLHDGHILPTGRDFFREVILLRNSNHDHTSELRKRVSLWVNQRRTSALTPPSELFGGLPRVCREVKGNPESGVELVRCFDFIVVGYPFPVSLLHLAAVPKGSVYDIRQLRRVHTPLVKSMAEKLKELSGILLSACVATYRWAVERYTSEGVKSSLGNSGGPLTQELEFIEKSLILGFNYPSEYGHLCMHAIVPPIRNFGLFEAPFFYPLKKVIRDLEHRGSVQPHPPSAALKLDDDSIMKEVLKRDLGVRELLGSEAGTCAAPSDGPSTS